MDKTSFLGQCGRTFLTDLTTEVDSSAKKCRYSAVLGGYAEVLRILGAQISGVGGKQQMKKLIPTILILIVACDNKPTTDTLTGDLYFSFFRLGNYYNQPDSIVQRFETYFDTLAIGTANSHEKKLLTQYKNLKDKGLLYHPFVYLLSGPDSVVALYLDTLDYEQIKKYKRQRLQDEHKKVRIEASVTKIDSGLFLCNKLKKVELIDGETLQRQKKLKIEDYK